MAYTIRSFPMTIACLLAAWQPSSVSARDDDTQLWLITTARGNIGPKTELTVDATARFREQRRRDEQQTLRATILHEVADGLAIGGGIGVFEAGGDTEVRPFQQLDASRGRFSARTRLEQRLFDGADRTELRFRQRLRYSQPLTGRLGASVEGEWLLLLQTRQRDSDATRDQWRGRVMLSREVGADLSLSAAYLAIYDPPGVRKSRVAHIPQLIIDLRF